LLDQGGGEIIMVDVMSKKINKESIKEKLQQVTDLLKFALTLQDEEIIRSTMESAAEILEEEIEKL